MSIFGKKNIYDEDGIPTSPVASIPTEPAPAVMPTTLRMKMMKPSSFAQAPSVADSLKAGQTVILSLEDIPNEDGRRMLDYIAGVIYALDGKIERTSDKSFRTFLLTPKGVSVDGTNK